LPKLSQQPLVPPVAEIPGAPLLALLLAALPPAANSAGFVLPVLFSAKTPTPVSDVPTTPIPATEPPLSASPHTPICWKPECERNSMLGPLNPSKPNTPIPTGLTEWPCTPRVTPPVPLLFPSTPTTPLENWTVLTASPT